MSRVNGANIFLPGHEAAAQQQQQAVIGLRLQLAGSIVGQLLPQQLAAQANRVRHAEGIFDEDKPVTFDPGEAIDQATNLAIGAADALLVKLGFIKEA